jgi:hypothetical protein
MAVHVRLLHDSDMEQANFFFNSIYGSNRSIENFYWEFVEGPTGKAIYVIAVDEGKPEGKNIVGIQCAIPIELIDGTGRIVLTAKSEDTLVDPTYRGQKIFERMYDLLFEECKKVGIQFIWGFTPAKKAFERIGFDIPFQSHQGLMVFNPVKAYSYLSRLNPQNKMFERIKIFGLSILSFIKGCKRVIGHSNTIEAVPLALTCKTEVIKTLLPESSMLFLNMNSEFIDWRIKRNPFGNDYQNFQFHRNGILIADVIVNFRVPSLGYIEQVVFSDAINDTDRGNVIKKLTVIMKRRVSLIRFICFDFNPALKAQEKLFRECGFVLIKRGSYFVWKNLESDHVNPNKLFLTRLFMQGNQ